MNNEEKEAIEKIKEELIEPFYYFPNPKSIFLEDTQVKLLEIILNLIDKLEKSNKEWFDIADNILRATNKYGEISIGEVANYISKLQEEIEYLKEKLK